MSEQGYSEITLLECNRQNSVEVKSSRTDSDPSEFTNDVGSINLQPYDQVSVHSVYVSEVGAEGGAIEFKGAIIKDKDGKSQSYTLNHTAVTNTSATDENIEGYRFIQYSPSSSSFILQDNKVNFTNSYYLTSCGETAVPLPRNFATICSYNVSLIYKSKRDALGSAEEDPERNGTANYVPGDTAGTDSTPERVFPFGCGWALDNMYRSREWNASYSDQDALGRNIFCSGMGYRADYDDRIDNSIGEYVREYNVPNASLISPVDYQYYDVDNMFINYRFDKVQLRTDNSKYTIYVRNNQFLDAYNASTLSNGSVFGDDPTNNLLGCFNTNKNGRGEPDIFGADVRIPELDANGRYPPRTRYYKYQDIQELSVPSGYNSTFNIADTLTKQLTDTQAPRTISANVGTYDFAADTIRSLDNVPTIDTLEDTGTIPDGGGFIDFYEPYKEVFKNYKRDISLVSENNTYKLFRGAVNYHWNNSSELIPITNQNVSNDNDTNIGATCNPMRPNNYGCFLNASETGRRSTASTSWTAPFAYTDSNENSSGLIDYMNNYVTLGIKRPEIYETGLDVNGLVNDSRNEIGFGAVTGLEFTEGLSVCYYGKTAGLECVTSWEWNASNLNTLRDFFIAQGKYPELFTNPPQGISGSNMTASNTRFLHVNTGRYGASGAGAALEEAYKTLGDEGTTFEISDVYEPTSTAGRSVYLDQFQHAMSKPLFIYYDWSRRNEANGGDTAYTKNASEDEVISIDTGNFDKLYYGFAMKHSMNIGSGVKDYIAFPLYPLLDKNILKIDPNQEAKHAFPSLNQHLGYGGWGYMWNSPGPILPGSSEPKFYVDLEETTYDGVEPNAAYTNNLPLNANGSFTPRRTLLSDNANASAGYRIGYDVHSTAYGNAFIVPYNGFPINGGIRSPQMNSTHWEAVNRDNASFSGSQVREIEAAYGQFAANASYTAAPPKFMAGQMLGLNSVFQQGFSISETFNNLVKAALYSEETSPYPTFIKFPYINVTPYLTHTYIGADDPLIQFNQTQNRFTLSRLHRAEYIGNFPNYEEATGDEQQVAYKINKKLQGNVWNPSLIPYPELDTSITLNSTSDVKSFTNTSPFIDPSAIFDATSGIYIDGIGLTEEQYKSSLWAILGFDRGQFINTNPDLPYGISEQTRVLASGNQGFNNLTTNARIDMNQQINWTNNIFGNSLFTQQMGYDTLFVPNAVGGWKNTSGTTLVDGSILATRNTIVQSASSVEIVATNLPRRTLRPYFVIRSDIVSRPSMIGGDQQPLPVVAIVDKVSDSGDFLYLSGGGQLSFTVTKPTTLSSIRTIITDPDGTNARVNNDSAVIYKIIRPINKSLQVGSNLFNTTNASLKQQTQPIQQKIQQLQAQYAGGRTNNRIARQIQQLQLQLSQIRSNMNQNFPQFNMVAQALAPESQVANNYVDESFNDLFTLDPLPFGDEAEPIEPTFTQQQTALDPQIPSNIPAMIESMNQANLRQAFFQELQSDIQSSRREQAIQRIVQQREEARRILSDQLNREPTDMEISDALGQFEEGEGIEGTDIIDDEANRTLGDISGISGLISSFEREADILGTEEEDPFLEQTPEAERQFAEQVRRGEARQARAQGQAQQQGDPDITFTVTGPSGEEKPTKPPKEKESEQ